MKLALATLIVSMCVIFQSAQAQNLGSAAIGAGAGASYTVSETPRRATPLDLGGFLWYSLNNRMGLVLDVESTKGKSTDDITVSGNSAKTAADDFGFYSTDMLGISARLRYFIFENKGSFRPYAQIGVGMLNYKNTVHDSAAFLINTTGTNKFDGMDLYVPVGVGAYFPLSGHLGLDLSLAFNPTFADNINPSLDDKKDVWWNGRVHLVYNFKDENPDWDGDGLSNEEEEKLGTDPRNPDTDGDGLKDGEEVNTYKSNPNNVDTDGDGLKDGEEVNSYKTDPTNVDTDGDGLQDGEEVTKYKTNPTNVDTDGDGLKDGEEVKTYNTDPTNADTDGDGLKDGEEVKTYKTNPKNIDTDGDGLKDGDEVKTHKTNPLKVDTDGDGLNDGEEVTKHKTNPNNIDTDGGTINDGIEVMTNKTNPNDPSDDVKKEKPKMADLEVGKTLSLQGIQFEVNKSVIKPESETILNEAYQYLSTYSTVEVEIGGHTDSDGKPAKNMKLSQSRADAVKAWLVKKGIAANRMTTKGYGPTVPVAPNDSKENKALNRRIEFKRTK